MQIIQTQKGPSLLIAERLFTEEELVRLLALSPAPRHAPVNQPVASFEFKRPEDTEGGLE